MGLVEVDATVDRAALDGEGVLLGLVLMPEPRAAVRAEHATEPPAAVGAAGPGLRLALRHAKIAGPHDHGNAEGRRRLLPAFAAVANIGRERHARDLVAHRAALAAAG